MTPFLRSINPSEISSVLKTILFFYLFKKGMSAISTSSHDKTYHNERLKESMENEGCILMTPYTLSDSYVKYMFNDKVYKVFPYKWFQGYRPHLTGKTSPTNEYVRQSFADENCELINDYINQRKPLYYRYKNKLYVTSWINWNSNKRRPHLNKYKCKYNIPDDIKEKGQKLIDEYINSLKISDLDIEDFDLIDPIKFIVSKVKVDIEILEEALSDIIDFYHLTYDSLLSDLNKAFKCHPFRMYVDANGYLAFAPSELKAH